MTASANSLARVVWPGCLAMLLQATVATAQVPIVQPGAPGETDRELSADQAIEIAVTSYSPDDAQFMMDMIPHHHQAVEMAALVAESTNRQELLDVAGRISASQNDEIEFMQGWLRDRGEHVPEPTAHAAMHTAHTMAGMASPEQMAELASSKGTDFDALFLQLMIKHHEGAVKMVAELLKQPGSAFDPVLFQFTTDITNDQNAEITRMNAVLASLSADPRAALTAGLDDAGQALMNMELIASLPKPPGFFDPLNPTELSAAVPKKEAAESRQAADDGQSNDKTEWGARSALLSFSTTEMAFDRDVMVVGSYHGFNIYKLGAEGAPQLVSSVVCPGGQGDVSIVGKLLLMSVEQTRGRIDCGLQGVRGDVSAERFRGLRIFDISDLARPRQVGQVQTCRGSHTHSVVASDDKKIIVYNSGTSTVRDEKELPGCIGEKPGDNRTALFRIDVIEIPVNDPSKARIVDSPAVFADAATGQVAGLWPGGKHGDDTQETSQTDQCHDITVFPERGIAAGACSGNGILFDISDPLQPKRIDEVVDKGFAYWHSATFNNDGSKVLYTDEWGGGSRPRCRASDPRDWGANAFYDIVDNQLEFRSHYKLPAPQLEQENCVAHNGSIIPVPGRDIFVQAWYQGGVSVIDFTDSAQPFEIAYFDRGPIDAERLVLGGFWSTYWYNGLIYGTEITRGLDVLALVPSEYLSVNEIVAATIANRRAVFNAQQQFQVTWPAEPVVARAYVDQLQRAKALSESTVTELDAALDSAAAALDKGGSNKDVARHLDALAKTVKKGKDGGSTAKQRAGLVTTLGGIAARLR